MFSIIKKVDIYKAFIMSVNLNPAITTNYGVQSPAQTKTPVKSTQSDQTQPVQTSLNPVDISKIDSCNTKTSSYDPASFKMPDANKNQEEPTRANGLIAAFAAFASMASGSYVPDLGNAIQKNTSDYLSLTRKFGCTVDMNPFGGIREPKNQKSEYETFVENNKALKNENLQ